MHLPRPDEQDWLIEQLALLIARAGSAQFLSGAIVLPSDQYFPDRWEPTTDGVARIAARLLAHAGMSHVRPSVALYQRSESVWGDHHVAAFFLGFEDQRCLFGVDGSDLDNPDLLVGTLAHEVAHAYRAATRLVLADHDQEELLTDLTAVYLGFGALRANGAYHYRSYVGRRGDAGNPHWSSYEHRRLGYLPYQALSFALAVQVVARDGDAREVQQHLSSAQAQSFAYSLRELRKRPLLRGLLGIGAAAVAPAPASAEPPMPASAPASLQEAARAHDTGSNSRTRFAGQDVYFWYDHHGSGYTTGAGAIALLAGMPIAILGHPLAYGVVVAAAMLAGWRYGRGKGWYKCATCGEILPAAVPPACPGCGGTIRARIRSPMDRLAIEEGQQ